MKYLLDTCTFLWLLEGSENLSDKTKKIITEGNDVLGVSVATYWEISIRSSLGKVALPGSLQEMEVMAQREDITLLPITVATTSFLQMLPSHHNDPFDRIIIATSVEGGWTVLTPDIVYDKYNIDRVW